MKILVLMPLQEQYSLWSQRIHDLMSVEAQSNTFIMPAYMDYLVKTKLVDSGEEAIFMALISAEKLYDLAEKQHKDLIVIGNIKRDLKFDAIFNFQDSEVSEKYQDNFVEKVIEKVSTSDALTTDERNKLMFYIEKLHNAEESVLGLVNCGATAELLSAYLQTDPKLDIIKEEYLERIKEIKLPKRK